MRGIPIGIFYTPDEVREVSLAASRVTHFDPAAGEASAFVNRMVSGMCRGEEAATSFGRALRACRDHELLGMLEDYRAYPPVPSLDAIVCTHCAGRVFTDARSFKDAVIAAINMGVTQTPLVRSQACLPGRGSGLRPSRHRGLPDFATATNSSLSPGGLYWSAGHRNSIGEASVGPPEHRNPG
jgi:hypothetical protein